MRYIQGSLLLLVVALLGAPPAVAANALAGNPSPYLAMHGEDPVDWQEWGPAALAQAREGNRPIFISSGYFACHWCHVMQRESYRNAEIAALLNRNFVPVKLDRELHPALDDYLIGFVERTAGQAGWPLNVFLTPEGHPMLGLTYAPPTDFAILLERISRAWEKQAEHLSDLARRATDERAKEDQLSRKRASTRIDPTVLARQFKNQALLFADKLAGGFGQQTRFPMAPNLEALLALQAREPDPALAEFLTTTLDAMMHLGLRDHLGGGFFRYTVDPDWHTPHFEKMLYNQALLAPLFLHAADILDRSDYRQVARETLDFMVRELRGDGGGFISSLSALDGQDVEGGYYLWHPRELDTLLTPDQRRLLALVWRLDGPPRHEAGLLPMLGSDLASAAAKLGTPLETARLNLMDARSRLAIARAKRTLPRDDKQLAGWNGLALSALVAGIRAFDDPEYRRTALAVRNFLAERLWDGKALHRAATAQGWIGQASLEDYAFVAQGIYDWGRLNGSGDDLSLSRYLVRQAWERFHSDRGWRLVDTPLLPGIPPERCLPDSPLPSPTAVLIGLTRTLNEEDNAILAKRARQALTQSAATVAGNPFAFAGHAMLLLERSAIDYSTLEETADTPPSGSLRPIKPE